MKWKSHMFLTFAIIGVLSYPIYRLIVGNDLNFVVFILALTCIIIGSILPDTDMDEGKSKIFHSIFLPVAIIVRFAEYPLALFLKKEAKHRGVLHHPVGIFFSSIIVLAFALGLLYLLHMITFQIILYLYLIILLSQLMHLAEDIFSSFWIYFVVVVLLVGIAFLRIRNMI